MKTAIPRIHFRTSTLSGVSKLLENIRHPYRIGPFESSISCYAVHPHTHTLERRIAFLTPFSHGNRETIVDFREEKESIRLLCV